MSLSLFQFQETTAATISRHVAEYMETPARTTVNKKPHVAPFFQALSALTGAGKTVIIAEAVSQISDGMPIKPVILWLSRGKVVVQQTFVNLSPGGKYHHLLDGMTVQALADYSPETVTEATQPIVYFATVGTFNQRDKQDGSLLVHKSDVDNMESSIWDALRLRLDPDNNRRPLVIVYDEAQNLSDQQTELLLELEPDGFLLASATMRRPARLDAEVQHIRSAGYTDDDLIARVNTPDVVAEGLVKDTVLLKGYNTPMEEAVTQLLSDWREATAEVQTLGLDFKPKSIYVCNTNVVADTPNLLDDPRKPFDQRQAPPILIWKFLVEQMGVDPTTVAVYSDLKTDKDYPLPEDFVLYRGADQDYEDFTSGDYQHVIFNLTLQEGWDDPSVYFAYIDKSMESPVQITQVIGRVLRQPGAKHYPSERLNSAHFYIRVDKNEVFNGVINDVKKQLGGGAGGVKIVVAPQGKPKPDDYRPKGTYLVPLTALDPAPARHAITKLQDELGDYRSGGINTQGAGSRRVLKLKVGQDGNQTGWEEYQHSSEASARWVFHREIQRQYKAALGIVNMADKKLNARVGIGSPAHRQVEKLAIDVVNAYLNEVRLVQHHHNPFKVGSILARPDEVTSFENAVHSGYAGLNSLELTCAEELDKTGLAWARNPPRSGYGIPLISVGPTTNFYPDFLVWTEERVICLDTKGAHLVQETAGRKLLRLRPPREGRRLDVQFISHGTYDESLEQKHVDGVTAWTLGDDGRIRTRVFDDMEEAVKDLVHDESHY